MWSVFVSDFSDSSGSEDGGCVGEELTGYLRMFEDWKEEAEFWDRTDTAPLMEDEEGEWVGPRHIEPAPGLLPQAGEGWPTAGERACATLM